MPRTRRRVPSSTVVDNTRSHPRRTLAFNRLRTAHDSTIRELVHHSWDDNNINHDMYSQLPQRSCTDFTGAAIYAAHLEQQQQQEEEDYQHQQQLFKQNHFIQSQHFNHQYPKSTQSHDITQPRSLPAKDFLSIPPIQHQKSSLFTSKIDDITSIDEEEEEEEDDDTIDDQHSNSPCVRIGDRFIRSMVRPVAMGSNWSFDLVAIWHNAIRLELADLEDIVAGLSVNTNIGISISELRAFFAWFSTFEAFVVTCLKAEEEILFPWIEQWGRLNGDLATKKRIVKKSTIFRSIRDTAACASLAHLDEDLPNGRILTNPNYHYYDSLKVGFAEAASSRPIHTPSTAFRSAIVEKISTNVINFSSALLNYFHIQEKFLPSIIDQLYDQQDRNSINIERKIIKLLWKCGRKEDSMVIISRAVELIPRSKQWFSRNFTYLERFTLPLWKRRYDSTRGAVTAKFKIRNHSWEKRIPKTQTDAHYSNFLLQPISSNDEQPSLMTSTASSYTTIPSISTSIPQYTPPPPPVIPIEEEKSNIQFHLSNNHQQTPSRKSSIQTQSTPSQISPTPLKSPLTSTIFSLNTTLTSLESECSIPSPPSVTNRITNLPRRY